VIPTLPQDLSRCCPTDPRWEVRASNGRRSVSIFDINRVGSEVPIHLQVGNFAHSVSTRGLEPQGSSRNR